MPCGWGCGAQLTAVQIREHFTSCPKRPEPVAANAEPSSRDQMIAEIERLVASGQAGYRIGREWGKDRLGLSLRDRLERRSTAQLQSILVGRAGAKAHNAGRCIICRHPEREKIEAELKAGASYREVGRRWRMNKQSVARHIDHGSGLR